MMRRVELLPASYAELRRQRQTVSLVIAVGIALVGLLVVWWFLLGGQISDAETELAEVQRENVQLQDQVDELQQFADLDAEVQTKRQALATVMAGDVDWSGLMTELAMVVPGEVWLTSLQGSAGQTESASPVGTEGAVVRINPDVAFGRLTFAGKSLSMPGVAKWLIRLASVRSFEAIWLNNASEESSGSDGPQVFTFDNTVEMNGRAGSDRFQDFGEGQ